MDNRNNNLGDQIKSIVEEAVDSMNFSQLNRDITHTVNSAVNEVRDAFGMGPKNNRTYHGGPNYKNQQGNSWTPKDPWNQNNGWVPKDPWNQNNAGTPKDPWNQNNGWTPKDPWNQRNPNWNNKPNKEYQTGQRARTYEKSQNRQGTTSGQSEVAPINKKPPGSVSGTICLAFGTTLSVLLGIAILVLGIVGAATGLLSLLGTVALGLAPLFIGSVYLAAKGTRINNRIKRFRQYTALLRGRTYCTIQEISVNTGKNKKYIIKDLRKMIQIGMFPQGRIDDKGTCFILTNETYQQYLNAQESMRQRKVEEEQNKKKDNEPKKDLTELQKAIAQGKEYIKQIKEANDALPGEEISRKLYRLEEIISKIFDCVQQHPEQLPEIRKFMEYYLPTTLKLVNAYREFEAQPVQGENITNSKREIIATLDTINNAFENLLDSLYEEAAMEISSDISVLQTLFAQEGLTGNEFETKKK